MKQANFLKVAAFAVAAPRYVGAFGASIGVSAIDLLPWLVTVELYSAAAMAALEGFALAFVWGKMGLLSPADHQYKTLLRFTWSLVLTLPVVALPYLITAQQEITIKELFSSGNVAFTLQIIWSIVVLTVPLLIVMAVGYADVDSATRKIVEAQKGAKVKLAKAEAQQLTEQTKQPNSKPKELLICEYCGEYTTYKQKALNGHKGQCKARANGKQVAAKEVLEQQR